MPLAGPPAAAGVRRGPRRGGRAGVEGAAAAPDLDDARLGVPAVADPLAALAAAAPAAGAAALARPAEARAL
jgi:hypothetical protein